MSTSNITTTTTRAKYTSDEELFDRMVQKHKINNRDGKINALLNNTEYKEKRMEEYDEYNQISKSFLVKKIGPWNVYGLEL